MLRLKAALVANMRILIPLILCLLVSCSESDDSNPIEPKPIEPYVQPPIREYLKPLLDTLCRQEFDFLVEQVTTYCQGNSSAHTFWNTVKNNLSEESRKRVLSKEDDINIYPIDFTSNYPFAILNEEGLIRAGIWSNDRKVKNIFFYNDPFTRNSDINYIYLQHVDNMTVLYLAFRRGNRQIWGDTAYLGKRYRQKEYEEMENYVSRIENAWLERGTYEKQGIPDSLNYMLLVVDDTGKPMEEKYEHLAIPYDEAPRATLDEVEEFNLRFNPDAYDCVE